jgi:hypothetical protein
LTFHGFLHVFHGKSMHFMPLSPARFGEPPKAWLYPSRVGRFEGSAQHHLNVPRRTPHFNLCCPTRRRSFNLQKVAVRFGGKLGFVFPWQVHFDAFCDEDGEMPNLQMWGPK